MTSIIERMPAEVSKYMLSFTATKDLATNVSRTSKALSELSGDATLWKQIADRSGIKITEKTPVKEQVLAHIKKCEELNTVFLTTIGYLKEQIQNNPDVFRFTLGETPQGNDPLDLYNKIIEWCAKDIEESQQERENQKCSKTLLMIKFFNEEASDYTGINFGEAPKELNDERLLELFKKAEPEAEPKEIRFAQPMTNYWANLLSEYPEDSD